MGNVLKLNKGVHAMSELPAALSADPWAAATVAQRRVAELREVVVRPLAELVNNGVSITKVAELFVARVAAETLDPNTRHVLQLLARDGDAPSVATIKRMLSAYKAQGKTGLLPKHTGRVRRDYGWEARAIELYNIPSKPGYMDVAQRLIGEGFAEVTESRVKRFIKALPATLGEHSPARVGKHLHKLKRQHFQKRHVNDLLTGEMFAGDGHTADCYVGHPNTGKPFRPELTVFLDVKSRFIAGWYLTESESAVSTLYALSHAMVTHDHVPAWVYIDQGPGYRSKMLSDDATGFYSRFDIAVIGALPGNPHGKGWIERFFRTLRDRHDKFFFGGQVYCGDDMAPEINRRLSAELAQGKRQLPSLAQYVESLTKWLEQYHRTPMDVLGGRTPAQVWAELTPVGVGLPDQVVVRPHELRSVQRQTVRLHNRTYFHESLALFDAKDVDVEYDLHNDSKVWVFDTKGRFICEAKLTNTIGVLPTSRIEEQRQKRLEGQKKRLHRHLEEAEARAQDAITAADVVAGLEHMAPSTLQLPSAPAADVIEIDLLNWRDKT
jgi:putative transposase